ncbi:hypothetical protein ALIPUT_02777 [Alistipes putredinis DSM 17216]|uniref:Uncharacterized protein n=1 Tax=Alistipes putredinis DSM 17216 TaxID=445970 RepID=B0N050_9BACT|nr:hypothetical protein ALIPUT_02777 [Alistipes putredinis DSM 17216]
MFYTLQFGSAKVQNNSLASNKHPINISAPIRFSFRKGFGEEHPDRQPLRSVIRVPKSTSFPEK